MSQTTPQPPTTPDYRQFSPSPQITPNGLPATSNPAITHAMLVSLQNVSVSYRNTHYEKIIQTTIFSRHDRQIIHPARLSTPTENQAKTT